MKVFFTYTHTHLLVWYSVVTDAHWMWGPEAQKKIELEIVNMLYVCRIRGSNGPLPLNYLSPSLPLCYRQIIDYFGPYTYNYLAGSSSF